MKVARYFMPLACSTFDYFGHLVHVNAEAKVLSDFFVNDLGFQSEFGGGVWDATTDTIRNQLRGWLRSASRTDGDVLVLYFATHGEVIDGELLLHWRGSVPGDRATGLT